MTPETGCAGQSPATLLLHIVGGSGKAAGSTACCYSKRCVWVCVCGCRYRSRTTCRNWFYPWVPSTHHMGPGVQTQVIRFVWCLYLLNHLAGHTSVNSLALERLVRHTCTHCLHGNTCFSVYFHAPYRVEYRCPCAPSSRSGEAYLPTSHNALWLEFR